MTVTNCTELHRHSSEFQSAIAKWVADRRCPIQLGDYLQELGLDSAADCARWAATEPDRPDYAIKDNSVQCGPTPSRDGTGTWYFFTVGTKEPLAYAADVPDDQPVPGDHFPTREACILWLLDNWVRGREKRCACGALDNVSFHEDPYTREISGPVEWRMMCDNCLQGRWEEI